MPEGWDGGVLFQRDETSVIFCADRAVAAHRGERRAGMAVRECRPASQRPLHSCIGFVLPARAPYRGALGTGRRGTELMTL